MCEKATKGDEPGKKDNIHVFRVLYNILLSLPLIPYAWKHQEVFEQATYESHV